MRRKTTILISICLAFSISAYSQVDLVNGIKWEYEMYQVIGSGNPSNKVSIVGDTTIDGRACKILEREFTNCNLRPKKDFIYQEDRQIYYYHFEDSLFHLLYDFGAEIGDTLKIRGWDQFSNNNDYFYLKVDSISSINIGLNQRKRFIMIYGDKNNLGEIEFTDYQLEIVEGAGCTTNFFYFYDTGSCDGRHVHQLRCYSHPELGSFGDSTLCNITTSTREAPLSATPLVYPNPFSNDINISISEASSMIILELYNGQGLLLSTKKSKTNSSKTMKINALSNLPTGIYYLNIKNLENDKSTSHKLFKISE
ncbi:MAG: T9SS type A sorting domain-containing protein [Saprospiraceae bacterium]